MVWAATYFFGLSVAWMDRKALNETWQACMCLLLCGYDVWPTILQDNICDYTQYHSLLGGVLYITYIQIGKRLLVGCMIVVCGP